MKASFLALGLVAAVAIAAPASAQFPVNTGDGGPYADGALDPNWTFSTDGGATFNQAFVVNQGSLPSPPWQATYAVGSDYHWISGSSTASGSGPSYLFRNTFDLTGWNSATFSFSFQCAMDNFEGVMFLNGVSFGTRCGPDNNFQFGAEHTISSGFNAGINTLDFRTSGDQVTDGFLLEITAIDADRIGFGTVPEPATMGLLAIGLTALAGVRRRRKA